MKFTLDDDEEVSNSPPVDPAQAKGPEAEAANADNTEASDHPVAYDLDDKGPPEDVAASSEVPKGMDHPENLVLKEVTCLKEALGLINENSVDIADTEAKLQNLLTRQKALLATEKLLEQQDVLRVLRTHLGFHEGRPVAAILVYRCCLAWQCLDVDAQKPIRILGQMIQLMQEVTDEDAFLVESQQREVELGHVGSSAVALAVDAEDPALHYAYWLGVLTTLLALTHHQLGMKGLHYLRLLERQHLQAQHLDHSAPTSAITESLTKIGADLSSFKERMAAAFTRGLKKVTGKDEEAGPQPQPAPQPPISTSSGGASGNASPGFLQADPNNALPGRSDSSADPLTLPEAVGFRVKLDGLVMRTYGVLRDVFKKQLAPLLPPCIQAGTLHGQDDEGSHDGNAERGSSFTKSGFSPDDLAIEQRLAVLRPWSELVSALSSMLELMKVQCLPRILIKCIMKQVLSFVDKQLFNQLLLRPECCCASNIRFVGEGLRKLDAWLMASDNEEYLAALFNDLKHIRQATAFLMTANKSHMVLQDVVELCPALNMQQMYRLCTTYYDDLGNSASAGASPTSAAGDEIKPSIFEEAIKAGRVEPGSNIPSKPQESATGQPGSTKAASSEKKEVSGEDAPATDAGARGAALVCAVSASTHSVPRSTEAVDQVSGELLEAFSNQGVHHNGGLIVTFLLDEDAKHIIANPNGVGVSLQVLQLVHHKGLYKGMPIPSLLTGSKIPSEVFAFLEKDLPLEMAL